MGRHKDALLVVWSVQMALLSVASFRYLRGYWPVKGVLGGTLMVGALLSLDMWRHHPADSAPWWLVYRKYTSLWWTRTAARWRYWSWRRRARYPHKVQEELLLKTLQDNANTEYGLQWGLSHVSGRDSFKASHPLTNYDHYKPYVDRVAEGHKNVMTADDVIFMALTSGTTGTHKKYPLTGSYAGLIGESFSNIIFRYLPMMANFKRTWEFRVLAAPRKLPCGIPLGGASQLWGTPSPENVLPPSVYKLTQEGPCFYAQAVFVLCEPELGLIDGFSSNLLYSFFKFVETHIDQICVGISQGAINLRNTLNFDIDDDIQKTINAELSANPGRAAFIRKEMTRGAEGFAKRIWPDLKYVFLAKSGSFAHAYAMLERTFLKGIDIVSAVHGGTECFPGVNIDIDKPLDDVYTMLPDVCFLEFIPLDKVDIPEPETLFIDQLTEGECYEIVSTNRQGLYRYRVGDVIKIVGFYFSLPRYVFVDRLGQRLNLVFERTPESDVYTALSRHVTQWPTGVSLVDYTSTESVVIETVTGERSADARYIVFIEVSPEQFQIPEAFSADVDATLCQLHEPYKDYRQKGSITPLSVIQVRTGTFDQLKHKLWGAHPNMQFKMPRVQRREALLEVLVHAQLATC